MLNLGIIGCGSVMQGPYMELVNKLVFKKIINLKSVSDNNKNIKKILEKKFKFDFFYTDYNKILNDQEINIVLILTSMNEHASIAKKALLKKKHVLVEKPMATNMKDLKELFVLAKKSKTYLVAAPFVILSPTFQAMHHELNKKTIGNVSLARARYGWSGPNWGEWYYRTGGGPLFDLGVYNITTLTGLLGPVKNIISKSSISKPFRKINGKNIKVMTDDNFQILLEFKNNCLAVITTGFTMQQYSSPAIELYGSDGTIQMLGDDWEPKAYEIWNNKRSSWELFKTPYANWPWASGFTHLIDCIIKKKKPIINLDHAYHVNEIMIKIYESSQKEKQVPINSSFQPLKFVNKIKIKKSHLDHDRNHDDL
ncbi:Gfo/Idh/MocA family oxidoreductase [bacterium]|nr:Gfo/Idh/MocA family oxidoreductase [bacterium]